jgi:hypothetical protein
MKTLRALLFALPLTIAAQLSWADSWSNVAINGQRLSVTQLHHLEVQLGSRILPGSYLVDASGCWLNLTTGASGCVGSADTFSRHGSGERRGDGSWNHWSNAAGAGVGGTADGCIYTTTGWSNC